MSNERLYFGFRIWQVGLGWYTDAAAHGHSRHATLADAKAFVRQAARP